MRKLGTAALAYSAAVFAAQYALPVSWLPYAAAIMAAAGAVGICLRGDRRLRLLLIALPAAAGMLWSWGYYQINVAPARALEGETRSVTAVVTDYSADAGDYSRVYLRLDTEGLPAVRTAVYDYGGLLGELSPGERLSLTLSFKSAVYYQGREIDTYTSKGVFLAAYPKDAPVCLGKSPMSWLYFPKRLARAMGESILACFPEDAAPLVKAVVTGDRTELYGDAALYAALGTAGLMHVVAVSGMNLVFFLGFLRLFLGKGRTGALVGIPFIWVFAAMAGAEVPVLRAAFMQTLVLIAPLVRREGDTWTTLPAALMLLLVLNPMSVAGTSLQLSFAAILGITLFSSRIFDPVMAWAEKRKWTRNGFSGWLTRFAASCLASTLGALVFTLPLVALRFGYVPMYSVLTNLLCLWAMEILFIAGFCLAALGLLVPGVAAPFCRLLAWLVRYVVLVVEWAAKLPLAALYTSNPLFIFWLAATYLLFLSALLLRGKSKFRPLLPGTLSVLCLCVAVFATLYINDSARGRVTVLDVGQGQCIAVFSGRATVLIDCGGSGAGRNAGNTAADFLLGQGRRQVDALILTHLHADHAGGVAALLTRVEVSRLILPADADDGDALLPEILAAAADEGTEVLYVEREATASAGALDMALYAPQGGTDANERGLIILASIGDFDMLVTGDAGAGEERDFIFDHALPELELYIVGHHGSKYSCAEALLSMLAPERAVISVGYNSYGHPDAEVLARLALYGAVISRTDEDGNVDFFIR